MRFFCDFSEKVMKTRGVLDLGQHWDGKRGHLLGKFLFLVFTRCNGATRECNRLPG